MLGWPVISFMASGQGLLKPSFMVSLRKAPKKRKLSQSNLLSLAPACYLFSSLAFPLGLGGSGGDLMAGARRAGLDPGGQA
jgi:hypothetical protein